jgi:hypothetical protein
VTADEAGPKLDLVVVTTFVGPGMLESPVNEDFGAFQRLVSQRLKSTASDGIGLDLILDQDLESATPGFSGAKVHRFDKRRQRITVAVAVPADLTAQATTHFLRQHVSAALQIADDYLRKTQIPGSLDNVKNALAQTLDELPPQPLSEADRYRQVEYARPFGDGPVRSAAELDASGRELRKVDIYADGAMDYAIRAIESGTTRLNGRPAGRDDVVSIIGPAAFAALWQEAIRRERPRGPITVRETA